MSQVWLEGHIMDKAEAASTAQSIRQWLKTSAPGGLYCDVATLSALLERKINDITSNKVEQVMLAETLKKGAPTALIVACRRFIKRIQGEEGIRKIPE